MRNMRHVSVVDWLDNGQNLDERCKPIFNFMIGTTNNTFLNRSSYLILTQITRIKNVFNKKKKWKKTVDDNRRQMFQEAFPQTTIKYFKTTGVVSI